MIDPTPRPNVADLSRTPLVAAPRRHDGVAAPSLAGASVPPGDAVLNVLLDGETMRLYTELRDPHTDRVLLRLPATYCPEEARGDDGASVRA